MMDVSETLSNNYNGDCRKFKLRELDGLNASQWRIVQTNDDVHSTISLCPVVRAILDTPQIQRLRRLKQLGVTETTYMTTTHCRFEHSLGVAHLAEKMLRQIQNSQPNLNIREKDILCVKIAGLCHDLGHGPFSHVYEVFLKSLKTMERQGHWLGVPFHKENYDGFLERPDDWSHEDASLAMIDDLLLYLGMQIDENNLDQPLKQVRDGLNARRFGICHSDKQNPRRHTQDNKTDNKTLSIDYVLTSRDWIFIKECIFGGPLRNKPDYIGRPDRNQEFLYDIVSNRYSGLDVDKMDYFARDGRRAKRSSGEVENKLIDEACVAWAECCKPDTCFRCIQNRNSHGKTVAVAASYENQNATHKPKKASQKENMHLMICYPEKLIENVMNFFQERFRNHQKLYTHKTSKASEYMICDILLLADQYYRISNLDEGDGTTSSHASQRTQTYPQSVPISRAMMYPSAYMKLTDAIIDMIQNTQDESLKPARMLVNRWKARKLYKMIGSFNLNAGCKWQNDLWELDENVIEEDFSKYSRCCTEPRHSGEDENDNEKKKRGFHDEKKVQDLEKVAHYDHIIVEKRRIHHGKKDKDPVSFVRFLPKNCLFRLRNLSVEDLPEATVAHEENYICDMPRSFMKQTLRFFCRPYGKEEFLNHVYFQYITWRTEGKGVKRFNKVMGQLDGSHQPVLLSQESEIGTPLKTINSHDYGTSSTNVSRKRSHSSRYDDDKGRKVTSRRSLQFEDYDSP